MGIDRLENMLTVLFDDEELEEDVKKVCKRHKLKPLPKHKEE